MALGTIITGLGSLLNSQAGAAIVGGLTNQIGKWAGQALQAGLQAGSSSSAQQGSSATQQAGAESGGSSQSWGQTGNVGGIANALISALTTPTGNNAAAAGTFNQNSATTANDIQGKMWNNANMLNMANMAISNMMSVASQSSAKRFNAQQAALERQWAQSMRQTAYQDTVADMKKAGLNPILAAQNGATGLGSGAAANISSHGYGAASAAAVPTAHTATMQAMYDYGNNTTQFVDRMLSTINNAKQSGNMNVANWLQKSLEEGTFHSAKAIDKYAQQSASATQQSSSSESKKTEGKISADVGFGKKDSLSQKLID